MAVTATDIKEPFVVNCAKCQHEWTAAYIPMEAGLFARVLKGLRCPMCGADSKTSRMGPIPKPTDEGDAMAWLGNGDTGTSSMTIWGVLTGLPIPRNHFDIPYDPDDFGRCYRLLKVMPEWRARLGEVADAVPRWKPFVDAWDELTALYEDELANGLMERGHRMAVKTYARMQELRGDK